MNRHMTITMGILLGVLLAIVLYVNAMAASCLPVYWDPYNGYDSNSGLSWAQPKRTVSSARTVSDGPIFLVAQGGIYWAYPGVGRCGG